MTLTQYKKAIKALSREELETHLFQLFKSNKVFKDIESSAFNPADNQSLLDALTKKLDRTFWKEQFSLSECKAVLKDYCSRTTDQSTIALMHLAFATEAAKLSATYGDFGNSFYNSIVSAADKCLDRCMQSRSFFDSHEDEIEKLIRTCGGFGYGVEECIRCKLDDVRERWYDDESSEDET